MAIGSNCKAQIIDLLKLFSPDPHRPPFVELLGMMSRFLSPAVCRSSRPGNEGWAGAGVFLVLISRLTPLAATIAWLMLGQAAHADLLIDIDKSGQRMTR
jgi:hypothetical protein